ncbi:hypothetical protein GBAR_LOCUS28406 [Geodia barretti]|uniref:Fibronectin type-III domain-containing protein n=1 Tax=Geodia barretti TaxID=519541 RepID=A0AA35XID0_GEOBA|nr:hypothetical protein GBAR_LOCUS28406 [Geodia barretti]
MVVDRASTRSYSGVLSAVVFFINYCSGPCIGQEILHAPDNNTVFLNQPAVFVCETDGGFPGWKVNGSILEDLSPELRSKLQVTGYNTAEGSRVENLTIPAQVDYNGTNIQCLVIKLDGTTAQSKNYSMRIQGPLSAVAGLRAISSTSSVTILWRAPFSLDVTGVDPDIWYSVLIYNVTDENNPTAILCTDCINITETHYTFTPDYLSPCHVYNFSVIPLNGAGQGESNCNLTGYFHEDISILGVNIFIRKKTPKNNMYLVEIETHSQVICKKAAKVPLIVHYSSTQTHCPPVLSVEASELTPDKETLLIKSEVALGRDCDYTVHLTSRNGAGDTNSTGTLSMSTRVLRVEVEELEGEVVVSSSVTNQLSLTDGMTRSLVHPNGPNPWSAEGELIVSCNSLCVSICTNRYWSWCMRGSCDYMYFVCGGDDYSKGAQDTERKKERG